MSTSLFVENYGHGIAFYINGDLQFDSADEVIYHENLVIPAISLAIQRFPNTALRVLICGGGDGLAARDVLRFLQIEKIDLVDYDPEVLELANTEFKPYNLGSLEQDKVTVYAQEAFGFVNELADDSYHVVICDFTSPKSAEGASIYSQEWFEAVNRILIDTGIIAVNGVSPNYETQAFWCLYQTLLSVNLNTKPLKIEIPSFANHDYGNWGFFLGSSQTITKQEIESIELPENLNYLTQEKLLQVFQFDAKIAASRHQFTINTLENEQLFYYLLNQPVDEEETDMNSDQSIDFLEIDEEGNANLDDINSLDLESVAKFWIENIYTPPEEEQEKVNIQKLVPVRHYYHEPKMTTSWLGYMQDLLSEIDVKQLLNSLLARAQELPPNIAKELRNLAYTIKHNQPLNNLNPKMVEFITLLSLTMLMANLVAPDSVFAKGHYYRRSHSSYGYSEPYSNSVGLKLFGLVLASLGGIWFYTIMNDSEDNN